MSYTCVVCCGKNEKINIRHVCGHCADDFVAGNPLGKYLDTFQNGCVIYGGSNRDCFLCGENRHIFFKVPCCEEHEKR